MNIGDSVEYLRNLEHDLASEPDPSLRSWYGQEVRLLPDYKEAIEANDLLTTFAGHIGELARLKASEVPASETDLDNFIEPDDVEYVRPPSAQEILMTKIIKKYDSCLATYQAEVRGIEAPNKSKRELKLKLARRNFAKQFTDLRDISDDEHIVLQPKLLAWATLDLIDDKELRVEVANNCTDYAERNGAKITSEPERLATIIACSVNDMEGNPDTAYEKSAVAIYDNILKAIFSSPNNAKDFSTININLALASFSLLASHDAVQKACDIFTLELPYMRTAYMYAVFKGVLEGARAKGDVNLTDEYQAMLSMAMLKQTYLGGGGGLNQKLIEARNRIDRDLELFYESYAVQNIPPPKNLDLVFDIRKVPNDPVAVKRVGTDTYLPIHNVDTLTPLDERVHESRLFNLRMRELAPYLYAINVAKHLLGTGVHTMMVPISPSVTIEAFIPQSLYGIETGNAILTELNSRMSANIAEFLEVGANAEREGIRHLSKDRKLQLGYMHLFPGDPSKGCVVFRPNISHDRDVTPPIQFLAVNHHRAVPDYYSSTRNNTYTGPLIAENEQLRHEIGLTKKRFLGRRPIRATMPPELQATGLKAVKLRTDTSGVVYADFELSDGETTLRLDRDFNIESDEKYGVSSNFYSGAKKYYENIVLKVAKFWSCSQELSTSEGIVNETSGNGANMGHYAYLRIRDGRKFKFSETQRRHCRDEQGLDLAVESQRLRDLDETGQARNSTYVRENYDPNKPPLEIHYTGL